MGLNLPYQQGQTPLDEDEISGLKISTISTHSELNEFEQKNIEEAIQWTMQHTFSADVVFTEGFLCRVHAKMFSRV